MGLANGPPPAASGLRARIPVHGVPAGRGTKVQTLVKINLQLTKNRPRSSACTTTRSNARPTWKSLFRDRFRTVPGTQSAQVSKQWMLEDFTLAEIRQLNAGAWFDPKFRGTRIPTFGETIDSLRGQSGLFIELKTPERYEGIERLILAELASQGPRPSPGADPRTRVLAPVVHGPPRVGILSRGTLRHEAARQFPRRRTRRGRSG